MVQKGIINDLIKSQDLECLEQHLIYSYLNNHELDYAASPVLDNYFHDFKVDKKVFLEIKKLNINSLKLLENYLELLIPQDDRKLNGAFFTPDYIVDFIINELKPKPEHKNLDPSCGCGAFLIGLVYYYKSHFSKSVRDAVKDNIYGSDILEYNIKRTKLLLSILALCNGEILEESDFNLYCQDSLRTKWDSKFHNIVGNPPYVKFQDLSDDNRNYLIKNWKTIEGGTFNLYFAFFELGYKLLMPHGKLGYITPNNYFTSLAGVSIRNFFQQKKCVYRIVDFNHKKVFDAQAYTAITFLNKEENESILFDRIKDEYNPIDFLPIANGSPNSLKELNAKKWRLLKTDEQNNIKNIETIGTPIGNLFDICVGIATLKDDIFFVDSKEQIRSFYLKRTIKGVFEIEVESTRSVYKIPDFKSQNDIQYNTRKVIFPYDIKNGKAIPIPEKEFSRRFPKCYAYLLSEKDTLLSRDKGKVKYDPFYVWGRTQGLTKTGKKILNPTFSQTPRFLMVEEDTAYFTNGYGLFFRERPNNSLFDDIINPISKVENIDVVQKILNSQVMHYYVSKTSVSIDGGFPCYQKNFIEKFSIPDFSEEEIQIIRNLYDELDIDEFLIQKYQLKEFSGNLVR